jgi:hypothetical protein
MVFYVTLRSFEKIFMGRAPEQHEALVASHSCALCSLGNSLQVHEFTSSELTILKNMNVCIYEIIAQQ